MLELLKLKMKFCWCESADPSIDSGSYAEHRSRKVLSDKIHSLNGDRVSNYIRYDNYNRQPYINFRHWEKCGFIRPRDLIFWMGDLYWVFLIVGAVRFIGLIDREWLERRGGGVLVRLYRQGLLKILNFVNGRFYLPTGGFKKLRETWALVFFSMVVSEALPYRVQITFLGYPLAILVFRIIFSLWVSSFFQGPTEFIKGIIPSGVSGAAAPFISILVLVRRWMRPLVLVMRISMAAILIVTLEGIFHYFSIRLYDHYLVRLNNKGLIFWSENFGIFRAGFLTISGVLGLDKLFYMRFQVLLLFSLLTMYHQEHSMKLASTNIPTCWVLSDCLPVWSLTF